MIAAMLLAAIMVQEPAIAEPPPPPDIIRTTAPDEVAAWVAFDLATLPESVRGDVFYLWLPPWGEASWHHAFALAVNTGISRAGTVQHPDVIGQGWLQRWYLPKLVPNHAERVRVARVLRDAIADDPYFRQQPGSPFFTNSGLHPVIAERAEPLMELLGIEDVPVMRGDYALEQMLSALDGGRYLEFRGMADIVPTSDRTAEQLLLSRFGMFRDQAIQVDGDERVGMWFSEVSHKPRIVLFLRGLAGYGWITDDMSRNDIRPDVHMIYNLLQTKPAGHEIILELPNGFHLYVVTDADGTILRQAPDHVVTDEVAAQYTEAILNGGAISCIRCHASGSGLRDCPNDVATMLSTDATILADLGLTELEESQDEIAKRYAGRGAERHLEQGRENLAIAVDTLTAGEMTVEELFTLAGQIYARRRWHRVEPGMALEEAGYQIRPFGPPAQRLLSELLAPVQQPSLGVSVVELPEIVSLRSGVPIGRSEFDRAFPVFIERLRLRGF